MSVTKKGKSIAFEVRAWWNAEDQMIHLASDASKTFILTVCDDPKDAPKKKARGHRKLFRALSKILLTAGVPHCGDREGPRSQRPASGGCRDLQSPHQPCQRGFQA